MFKKKYTLLKSQKKEIYEILMENGLEPAEFSWSKEEIADALIVSRLTYRDGRYYFQFSSYEMNAWCVAAPGAYRSMDYEYPKNWREQVGIFRNWTHSLKRELDSSDPWAELEKYRVVLDGEFAEQIVNEPIPSVEADRIAQGLVRLEGQIAEAFSPNKSQNAAIRTKLGYLAEAAERQRSRDWIYTMLGVCSTIAAVLSVPESGTAKLWGLFETELRPFARLLPGRAAATTEPGPRPGIAEIQPRPTNAAKHRNGLKTFLGL